MHDVAAEKLVVREIHDVVEVFAVRHNHQFADGDDSLDGRHRDVGLQCPLLAEIGGRVATVRTNAKLERDKALRPGRQIDRPVRPMPDFAQELVGCRSDCR